MDNSKQIAEIRKYRLRLSKILRKEVDENIAAEIWIRKYAHAWRLREEHRRLCA